MVYRWYVGSLTRFRRFLMRKRWLLSSRQCAAMDAAEWMRKRGLQDIPRALEIVATPLMRERTRCKLMIQHTRAIYAYMLEGDAERRKRRFEAELDYAHFAQTQVAKKNDT